MRGEQASSEQEWDQVVSTDPQKQGALPGLLWEGDIGNA
jgi:hypothetical protein